MHPAKRFLDFISRPFTEYLPWTLIWFVLLVAQDLVTCAYYSWKSYIARPLFLMVYDGWVTYVLILACLLLSARLPRFRQFLLTLVTACVIVFAMGGVFLHLRLGQYWNGSIFAVILATTPDEAMNFVLTYVCSWPVLLCFVAFVALAVLYVRVAHRLRFVPRPLAWGLSIVCLLLLPYWGPAYSFSIEHNNDYYYRMFCPPCTFMTYQAVIGTSMMGEKCDQCLLAQQGLEAECATDEPLQIVLVIGESFIRSHSSLYGYYLPTNPRLAQQDSLLCFDNVTTSHNMTYMAFTNMLSMASVDDTLQWYQVPLLPALFRQAGYHTVLYSNQFSAIQPFDAVKAIIGFIDRPDIMQCCFDHQNPHCYEDWDFIDRYAEDCSRFETGQHRFTIVHLKGQHFEFKEHFPKDRVHFTRDDIRRPDLTGQERQIVADYDNATLFNDSVVSAIFPHYADQNMVLVYLSDHGEEAYDYQRRYGRSFNFDEMPVGSIRSQIDIPFMVYASPLFRATYPETWSRLQRAVHRPFQSDDLPHLLLDLAHIKTPWYVDQRNPLSDSYNESRIRTYNEGRLYPERE